MKKILLLLCVVFTGIFCFSEIIVNSSVKNVEIYPNMGKVAKNGNFKCQENSEKLIFEKIPLSADIDSFTFSIKDVEVLNIYFEKKMEDNKQYSQELELLYKEKKVIENDIYMQDKIENIINKALFSENIRFEPGKDFISLINDVENRMKTIMSKKDELNKKLEETKRNIEIINSKKNSSKITYYYNAILDVNKLSVGKDYQYSISYVVKNCGWKPEYSINASSKDNKVDFKYKAEIYQNTGEDWKNAEIILSTSRPSALRSIPQLNTWDIYVNEPISYRNNSLSRKSAPSAMFDSMAEMSSSKQSNEMLIPEEKVKENFLGYSFNVGKLSINDGEKGKKINIEQKNIEAEFEFLLIPNIMKESLLTGIFKNELKMPFLDGQALVFLDSDYRGKQNISFTAVKDTIEISFGNFPELFCIREKTKDKKSEIGIISKAKVLDLHYNTIVKNRSSRKLDIKVKERIPISKDSRIIVRSDYTKKGLVENKDDMDKGILNYNISIESGKEEEFYQKIKIEFPTNIEIGGI
ncbi:MAG: DUF4139 domain-containing protein [Candidatus Muirbacterium halophilum]|nr:DUF4139 domain-containing protein [Candidatus Muirbacterium halophilum]MCK9476296.1 DUF4139 domain-containing protein [Candidatus Muirbacterium halophilum]